MSKQPQSSVAGDEESSATEKQPKIQRIIDLSATSKENINSFKASSSGGVLTDSQNLNHQQNNNPPGQVDENQQIYLEESEELAETKAKLKAAEEKSTNLEIKNVVLQNINASLAAEKVTWIKRDIDSKAENKELRKKLADVEKTPVAGNSKHVEERGEDKGKKEKSRKRKKESNEENPVEEKLNTDNKKLNLSLLSNSSFSKVTEPKWKDVSKAQCEAMFKDSFGSTQQATSFLNAFSEKLFERPEILQPFDELGEKIDEIKNVINYFYPADTPEVKRLYFTNLKARLSTKRNNARETEYNNCNSTRCVAFTSSKARFYYSVKWQDRWNSKAIWKPYWDKDCQDSMPFKKPDFSSFAIPRDYAGCTYILIFQRFDAGDKNIYKIVPKTGCMKRITPDERKPTSKK